MKSESVIERRAHPRGEALGKALVIDGADSAITYHLESLSAGGALLTGGPQLPLYRTVRMVLRLAGVPAVSIDARVVWHAGDAGSGVAFVNLDAAMEDRIQDVVLASLSGEAFPAQQSSETKLPSWLP